MREPSLTARDVAKNSGDRLSDIVSGRGEDGNEETYLVRGISSSGEHYLRDAIASRSDMRQPRKD